MSNIRPPYPNGHPHDDDLQLERWADAPQTDADALDALLNEIAQGNGAPSTRSGQSHGPDVRTDDGDAVLQAARRFHHRFDASAVRDADSAALDPHLWETIMTTTNVAAPGTSAQGTLWADATRKAVPPRAATTRRPRQADDRRAARGWSGFANATLALVILLAGFGVWRIYDGMNASGPTDPEGTIPGLAMQPATPDATEPPAVAAPPVATPDPISACDFRAGIPIFPGVDESPIDGTALLLTTAGELVLTCPEEPDPVILATGIDQAGPLHWPGTVFVSTTETEPAMQTPSVVNVMTGRSVEIGMRPESVQYQLVYDAASPWLVAPAATNPQDWAITDLRTMESRLLSDYANTAIPEGASILTSATADGALVVGLQARNDNAGEGELIHEGLMGDGNLPGDLLVLDGSLDVARWIEVPNDLPAIRELNLAPDGQHLALRSAGRDDDREFEVQYSIIRMTDGGEVARSASFNTFDTHPGFAWVQGGAALAYLEDTGLKLLGTASGESVTLLDGADGLSQLRVTSDPNVVTVFSATAEKVATETPDAVDHHMATVNTVTGDVIESTGMDASDNSEIWYPPSRFLVMSPVRQPDATVTTYIVVDAATGKAIGEFADVPMLEGPWAGLGRRASVTSADGNVEVIGFGSQHLYLMHMVEGTPALRQLAPPERFGTSYNGAVSLFLSPDGAMLSLTIEGDESRNRWLLPLDGEPDDWIEVPSTVPGEGPAYIFFVPGTGD